MMSFAVMLWLGRECQVAGETATDDQIDRIVNCVIDRVDQEDWPLAAEIALGFGCVGVYTDLRERMSEMGI